MPEERAVISVFDRGFLYGDGVFETMRAYQRRVFRFDDHIARLIASAAALKIRLPRTPSQVIDDIHHLLEKNDLNDAVIRVAVSRGRGQRGPRIEGADTPTYVLAADTVPDGLRMSQTTGIRLGLSAIRRISADALPPGVKHANYLNSILALEEALQSGADEAVMLDANEHVTECAAANIFFIHRSCVHTPPPSVGILTGVTRALVLALAKTATLATMESPFGMDSLLAADEIFVTNSVIGLCPVRSVNGKTYAAPGPVTQQLISLYSAQVCADTGGIH